MTYDPQKHHRRSIRLKEYNYTQPGAYFITICTHEREGLLGHIENGAMILSEYGRIVEGCWRILPGHFQNVELDEFVVMPNHVHGVIIIVDFGGDNVGDIRMRAKHSGEAFCECFAPISPLHLQQIQQIQQISQISQIPGGTQSGSLGAIIQNFKSVSTRKINQRRATADVPLWQRNYYERIIRNEDELNRIRCYIRDNPLNWETDVNYVITM